MCNKRNCGCNNGRVMGDFDRNRRRCNNNRVMGAFDNNRRRRDNDRGKSCTKCTIEIVNPSNIRGCGCRGRCTCRGNSRRW